MLLEILEIDQYLKEPLIQFHCVNSYSWWKNNTHRFPQLLILERKYRILLKHLRGKIFAVRQQ